MLPALSILAVALAAPGDDPDLGTPRVATAGGEPIELLSPFPAPGDLDAEIRREGPTR